MADNVTINGNTFQQPTEQSTLGSLSNILGGISADIAKVDDIAKQASDLFSGGVKLNISPTVTIDKPTVNVPITETIKRIAPWIVGGVLLLGLVIFMLKK
jgi:hypothetical protein